MARQVAPLCKTVSKSFKGVYDAVIIGGGVAGSSMACSLASSPLFDGKRVGLIDVQQPATLNDVKAKSDVDVRVFALSPASARVLQRCGVWSAIRDCRVAEFTAMQVWDDVGSGFVRFDDSDHSNCLPLGYIAENRVLHSALFDRALQLQDDDRMDVLVPKSVKGIDLPQSFNALGASSAPLNSSIATVRLEDGAEIKTRLVVRSVLLSPQHYTAAFRVDHPHSYGVALAIVSLFQIGADGGNSFVRRCVGIGTHGYDYDQRGLVATVRLDRETRTAWQRFMRTGPIAMLPLWDDLCSIVWSTSSEHAQALQQCSEAEFVEALQEAFSRTPTMYADSGPETNRSALYHVNHALSDAAEFATRAISAFGTSESASFRAPPQVTELVGPRASFPLKIAHANSYTKPGLALIG